MAADPESAEIAVERSAEGPRITLTGKLNAAGSAAVWERALAATKKGAHVDVSGVTECDSTGAALIYELEHGRGASIEGMPADAANLLKPYGDGEMPARDDAGKDWESAPVATGRAALAMAGDVREQLVFTGQAAVALVAGLAHPGRVRWGDMWRTVETAGVNALLIVGMIGFLTGMIMAFQSSVPLQQFGVDIFVVNLVALAMLRELGGIMTAIVLAGRSGSAFAAEIGTMKVNEEVNALTTMGIDPVRFLVVPKLMAAIIVTPLLTIYANVIGIGGGLMVVMMFGHPWSAVSNQLVTSVHMSDIFAGLIKSVFFGALVGGIGCLRGLQTKSGASAVGDSTTSAVVSGIFLIILVDAIFAVVFMPSNSESNLIEVRGLRAGYGDEVILEDVSFDVRKGEIFVILGGSGCGKSTLLKHLIGLYPPMAGEVRIEGRDLVAAEGDERQAILRRIGVSYQSGALFGSFTLGENVALPLEEYTDLPAEARELIAWMKLRLVGLEKSIDKLPSELSGGMQKRAAIARAMALDPVVVFLDEPSAGLDPITAADLDALIIRLNESMGMTFVIVTHELASIYAIADRVIMLDRERKGIIAEGEPEELRDHSDEPFVRQFFHREASEKAA